MIVQSSKPVTISEVKEILKKRGEEGELGYEQKETLEYVDKFAKDTKKDANSKVHELMKDEKITIETAVKIVDLKPSKIETLRAILIKDRIDLNEEQLNNVIKIIS